MKTNLNNKRRKGWERKEKAVALAQKKAVSTPVHTFSEKAEEIISVVDDKLEGIVSEEQKRFFAIKLLEKDDKIAGQMKSVPEVSNEIKQMEEAKNAIQKHLLNK